MSSAREYLNKVPTAEKSSNTISIPGETWAQLGQRFFHPVCHIQRVSPQGTSRQPALSPGPSLMTASSRNSGQVPSFTSATSARRNGVPIAVLFAILDGHRISLMDTTRTFNTELMEVVELGMLLDCCEATVAGALARTESRGAHYRRDFEERDDVNFLRHTLAYQSDVVGQPELRYKPVVITEFQPKERKY